MFPKLKVGIALVNEAVLNDRKALLPRASGADHGIEPAGKEHDRFLLRY